MSEENILYDSSKSELVIKEKEERKKMLRNQIIFFFFSIPLSIVFIMFLWSLGLDHEEGVWYPWFVFRIFPIFILTFFHIVLIMFHLRLRYRQSWEDIIIAKDFIEITILESRNSIENLRFPLKYIDKFEIEFGSLYITITNEGKKDLGLDFKGISVYFFLYKKDRNFYKALQLTGKIELSDKDIDDIFSDDYVYNKEWDEKLEKNVKSLNKMLGKTGLKDQLLSKLSKKFYYSMGIISDLVVAIPILVAYLLLPYTNTLLEIAFSIIILLSFIPAFYLMFKFDSYIHEIKDDHLEIRSNNFFMSSILIFTYSMFILYPVVITSKVITGEVSIVEYVVTMVGMVFTILISFSLLIPEKIKINKECITFKTYYEWIFFKFKELPKSIKCNEIKECYIVYSKIDKSINRIKLKSLNQNIHISDFSQEARNLITMKLLEKVEDKYIRARATGE